VDEDLLGCFLNRGGDLAFDELAAFEAGAGTDEGNEVARLDGAPAGLGGLDQLEGQPLTPGTCPALVYVYVWADGVHVNIRLEDERLCLLVLIGVRADGRKELITLTDG
jgi:hypothetical protein